MEIRTTLKQYDGNDWCPVYIKTSADMVELSNGKTVEEALNGLETDVRLNILDNAIFIGGGTSGNLPINQRGESEYTGSGNKIDRWNMIGIVGRITLKENGIYFEKTADATSYAGLEQKVPLDNLEGKPLTLSCLIDEICYYTTVDAEWVPLGLSKKIEITHGSKYMALYMMPVDNYLLIRFYYGGSASASSTGYLLQAVKLELGSTQTLAYQDVNGTWKLRPQPDSSYVIQLLKCRRYFRRFPANYAMGVLQDENTAKNACFRYECNPPMRAIPVLSMQNQSDLTAALDDGKSLVTPTEVVLGWRSNENVVGFYFKHASGTGGPGFICNRYIDASAEL